MKFGMMFANVGPFVEPDAAVGLAHLAEEVELESTGWIGWPTRASTG